jgi:hypothetical protein
VLRQPVLWAVLFRLGARPREASPGWPVFQISRALDGIRVALYITFRIRTWLLGHPRRRSLHRRRARPVLYRGRNRDAGQQQLHGIAMGFHSRDGALIDEVYVVVE